ncbi:MAG: PKD domain-containing protein [Lacibacter sp.]
MKEFVTKSAYLFFCLLVSFGLKAQLNAEFSVSNTQGCAPLKVSFSSLSTGTSSSTTYSWNLGNGNSSVLTNPSAIYYTEGTYTVTLTIKDGNQTSVKSKEVKVVKKPTVDFNWSSSKGCLPFDVTFNSTSTAGDGYMSSYYWDFGDGTTQQSSSPSITHVYQTEQKASVTLTAVNQYGCYNTITKNDIVEIIGPLTPDFTVDQTVLCKITDEVKFTNKSTGPGTLSYLWDFGDGTTSTATDPKHIYNVKGIYTIKLTVTSSEGCVNIKTISNYVNVASYKADFNLNATELCLGNYVQVNTLSTPAPSSSIWKMGDGNTYYNSNYLSHYYYNPGIYDIKLINSFGNCTDSITKSVKIKPTPVINGFVDSLASLCGAPVQVYFRDTTAGAVKWEWDFNYNYSQNVNSTLQAPTYTYAADGYYQVRLKVENGVGCSATTYKTITIRRPSVNISYLSSTAGGTASCEPFTVKLTAYSSEPIISWKWIFSDGTTSTEQNPEHTFSTIGAHLVQLNYTTINGCTGTTSYTYMQVLPKPVAKFTSLSGTDICGNTVVHFDNQSTGQLFRARWLVDGISTYGIYFSLSDTDLYYQFTTPGKHTITLIATNGVCDDTMTIVDYIDVKPPFVKINGYSKTCNDKRDEVVFTDGSTQANSWLWNFGDGVTSAYTVAQSSISHKYAASGNYKVKLSVTNGSCTVSDSVVVSVLLKQAPQLSSSLTNLCAQDNLSYSISGLEPMPGNSYWNYYFSKIEYGDNSQFNGYNNTSPYYYIDHMPFNGSLSGGLNAANNKLRMIMYNNSNGCYDTTNYISYTIKGAVAGFTVVADNLCYQSPVVFKDTSKVTGNNSITSWEWNFGDGVVQTFATGGTVNHTYVNPGGYYVTLKITDAAGCSSSTSSYSRYVQVKGPKAAFYTSGTNVPLSTNVYFYNNTNTYNSYGSTYVWDFGDGSSTSTSNSPSHIYTVAGTYMAKLTATDPVTGCTSSATQTIIVREFNSNFSFNTNFISSSKCPPVIASFTNTSAGAVRVTWDFGDGTTAGNLNYPSHTYTQPGKYIVKLFVYGYNGLTGTYTDSVIVKGMQADITFNPSLACASQQIDFKSSATEISSYLWDFGDGVLLSGTDSNAIHFYKSPGVYKPAMLVTNSAGCIKSVSSAETIIIDSLSAAIKGIPAQICNQANINFLADIYSVGAAQSPDFLRYKWDFGTGVAADTSNTKNPSFNYTQPGTYTVSLKVYAKSGCYKEAKEIITVRESSKGTISGPLELCPGQTASFTSSATITNGVQWAWDFKNGQTAAVQNPSAQLYNTAGSYPVTLIVNNQGCADTSTHLLTVHADPVPQVTPSSTTLCTGKSIQLNASGGTAYQWTPVTGLDNALLPSPLASPTATTTYSVKVTNQFGCSKTGTVQVKVVQPFKLTAKTDYSICEGESIALSANGASTYKWINNTQGLSNTTTGSVTANPLLTTAYTIVGYDSDGCFTDTATINLTVNSKPQVNAGPDVDATPGAAVQLNPVGSSDITKWLWSPATYLSCTQCASPVSTATTTTTYILNVFTAQNCMAADTVTIKILCNGDQIYIPNAFTPNNDTKNDVFGVIGNGASLIKSIVVFNRWGNKVFERRNVKVDDPTASWDGIYMGYPAEIGSYTYFTELICDTTGETFIRRGVVMLIR